MEVLSYLAQLKAASATYGVALEDAAEAEGIAHTTLWRWHKKDAEPKYSTTSVLIQRMRKMARSSNGGQAA